nr:ribonuclease H-like domain-containing protein [Tanacetum cinerariifolium]
MTGPDNTSLPTPLSEKLSLVRHNHLLTRVPVKLDLDNWNYGSWEFFFEQLCYTYDICFTLSDPLQAQLVVARPKSAKEAWGLISDIVKDNKRSRTNALKAELRSIKLVDQSMESYFQKIDSIVNILTSLDAHVNDEDVVYYALECLPNTYNQRSCFARSPMVLMANSVNYRFGEPCRYVHGANARLGTTHNRPNRGHGNIDNTTNELLQKLRQQMSNFTCHTTVVNPSSTTSLLVAFNTSMTPSVGPIGGPNNGPATPSGFAYPVHPVDPNVAATPGHYISGPTAPTSQAHQTQAQQVELLPNGNGFQLSMGLTAPPGQATNILHAFSTESLRDPNTGAWNIYTGASSHLNSSSTCLSNVFNTCLYPSVLVGDGHPIPVTNSGHSILPTSHGSLYLRNVLITPSIVKKLIYVRQFVCDNNCTIEFDAFGFSVKDFTTRQVLLRCDSTRDLYSVTLTSPIP